MGRFSSHKRDNYYRKAKELGYRARSAFKLLQLHDQFGFLNKDVKRVVDLCAAPGSWCQVLSSIYYEEGIDDLPAIVAVDLQEIAPIPGVQCIQGDITVRSTASQIATLFDGQLADLVICDGAPDVTGLHDIDEYLQWQLLAAAVNITTHVLRPGGTFVSKIFRGKNADTLLTCYRTIFKRVTLAKPHSSRVGSSEWFVVCEGLSLPPNYKPNFAIPSLASGIMADSSEGSKTNDEDGNDASTVTPNTVNQVLEPFLATMHLLDSRLDDSSRSSLSAQSDLSHQVESDLSCPVFDTFMDMLAV